MSRASKHLDKERKKNKLGKSIPVYCTHCGAKCSDGVYDMDNPYDYICKMCGEYAFKEIKEVVDKVKNNA